jgi:hypothetical protein
MNSCIFSITQSTQIAIQTCVWYDIWFAINDRIIVFNFRLPLVCLQARQGDVYIYTSLCYVEQYNLFHDYLRLSISRLGYGSLRIFSNDFLLLSPLHFQSIHEHLKHLHWKTLANDTLCNLLIQVRDLSRDFLNETA